MEQYISKSVLVAEIERRLWLLMPKMTFHQQRVELEKLISFIDTLEVKEMDLEKHLKEDIEDVFFDLNGVAVKGATHYLTVEDVKDIAKHFYELGMLSTITEEDCKLIWNIGDEIPNMPEEDFFGELLRRYKAQKGEEV